MNPERPDRATLLRELRAVIVEAMPALDGRLSDDERLITSALIDSTALVSVALWVERHVGQQLDPGELDLVREWDSMTAIVDFVERHGTPPA